MRRRRSRHVIRWTKDHDDELVADAVQAIVEDEMEMVTEIEVAHPSKTIEILEVPHPSGTEAPTHTYVTPKMNIEALYMDDIKVTSLIKTKFTALASIKSFVHTDEGFPRGPNVCYWLTGYADHVEFILWKGEVCGFIYY